MTSFINRYKGVLAVAVLLAVLSAIATTTVIQAIPSPPPSHLTVPIVGLMRTASDRAGQYGVEAGSTIVYTDGFAGNFDATTTDVQTALDIMDDVTAGGSGGLTQAQVDTRIRTFFTNAVTGNTETGIDVTFVTSTDKLNFTVTDEEALVGYAWYTATVPNPDVAGSYAFTVGQGGSVAMSGDTNGLSATLPAVPGSWATTCSGANCAYIVIVTPDSLGYPTQFYFAGSLQTSGFTEVVGTLTIGGDDFTVARTQNRQDIDQLSLERVSVNWD